MENKASYFWVGIFIFGVFFASLIFMLWLGGYSEEESFEYYEIHTQESVAGLGLKAPVRLLGVEVGSVENISIYTKQNLGVNILIKVKKETPIKEDTFATLQLQGITGLKFIQLQGGSVNSKKLTGDDGYPVIAFRESFLATIDRQGERIFSLIKTADDKSKRLLSDENLQNIEMLLKNLAQLSENLNANSKALSKNLNEASKNVALMAKEVELSAKNLRQTLQNVDESSRAFTLLMQKGARKIDSYDELRDALLEDLELLKIWLLESNKAIKNLQRSPSDLIFKETQPKLGPGER
ncbi:MCE family protein [Campylobacter upsaliensis]|uniref:MCE family protein n=1 Tax=Campylobacter upsaliensis TaxID=28080 RepID=A0A5L4SWF2_CAMUP|nr:MlaD family protein [Campylobacter upsaliensis]EAH4719930.1 MCE family protein [Campylobacter upsaliensis]EAH5676333.1 MCE family protein [Campylobacter upsaliensis]EAH5977227.1 MCE family protein [Campylobacter upsaliensis]EAI4456391.1 MCE family protein [Campylobacter upsaliensis]EAI8429487.1 MCE family protein [Campylobacter upsaliensis]